MIVEVFANDDWLRGHGRELPASFLWLPRHRRKGRRVKTK